MRINIDDRIVANYDKLPQIFMGKQMMSLIQVDAKEKAVMYENLERMEKYGMVTRNSALHYMKVDLTIADFFKRTLKSIKEKNEVEIHFNPNNY